MRRPLRQIHPDNAHLEEADVVTEARAERMREVAAARQRGLMVLMEDVYNPFNLAAIARTCDAFGVQSLGFMCQSREAFDPREAGALASRSAAKWIDYTLYEGGTEAVLTQLKAQGCHVVATVAAPDAVPLPVANLRHERLLLLIGNERHGLSAAAEALADTRVVIPMAGMVQSLNVSVAAALALYEIVRQRGMHYLYTPAEAEALVQRWLAREAEAKHSAKRGKDR
jgi:tRNA (guanosine-2'-O-)-methyltransferase